MNKLRRLFLSKLCFVTLTTLRWHYWFAYRFTRAAANANLADLNRHAMQHDKL